MKKTLVIAGISSILLACINNASHEDHKTDTVKHDSHAMHNSAEEKNEITETMSAMMQEMHKTKPTGNNDVDFSVMMMEHHRGAVEMSKVEIAKGTNADLKKFGQQVINDQEKEIVFMENLVKNASPAKDANSAEFLKAMDQSMLTMMKDSTEVYNNIDRDFAAQMIPHHQSAVDMARAYLKFGKNKELVTLCNNIISSQSKEIEWLGKWLKEN